MSGDEMKVIGFRKANTYVQMGISRKNNEERKAQDNFKFHVPPDSALNMKIVIKSDKRDSDFGVSSIWNIQTTSKHLFFPNVYIS